MGNEYILVSNEIPFDHSQFILSIQLQVHVRSGTGLHSNRDEDDQSYP